MSDKLPIISLWMPWANWVMLEWKPIETRTHKRFAGLVGKRIGIHASIKWDHSAISAARPYLTAEQIVQTESFLRIGGAILGTALVTEHRRLTADDSQGALIECKTERYGLFLSDVKVEPVIPCRGKQGIWYYA
jgi:hypothetical protein